ncbi:MAG: hypothetical protein N3F05_02530 [Candidatus Diapherotrites archaeon]|nr:hypothetical protein [Candidatus Diapherotrites archaeon]
MAQQDPLADFEENFEIGTEKQFKRTPAKECYLNEITGSERRIAAIVSIISLNPEAKTVLVSDGTAEAIAICERSEIFSRFKKGAIMRIIANPLSTAPIKLNLEIAQELKDFDANLFRKVKQEWGKLRQ